MAHITDRELLMLKEGLLTHETLIEKYAGYLNEISDQQIRSVIQRHQETMMQHYQELYNLVQPGIEQTGYQQSGYIEAGWNSPRGDFQTYQT